MKVTTFDLIDNATVNEKNDADFSHKVVNIWPKVESLFVGWQKHKTQAYQVCICVIRIFGDYYFTGDSVRVYLLIGIDWG